MNNITQALSSNVDLLRDSQKSLKAISALDFVMQVQPLWPLYLFYTAIRCASLICKYVTFSEDHRPHVWQAAQLYAGMKVAGLVVSQAALTMLGLTTIKSVAAILSWGGVLASCSIFAHHKAISKK